MALVPEKLLPHKQAAFDMGMQPSKIKFPAFKTQSLAHSGRLLKERVAEERKGKRRSRVRVNGRVILSSGKEMIDISSRTLLAPRSSSDLDRYLRPPVGGRYGKEGEGDNNNNGLALHLNEGRGKECKQG